MRFFFDTHAILGILFNEPEYQAHALADGVTHELNVLEALVRLVRSGDDDPLDRIRRMGLGRVSATQEALLAAAELKVRAGRKASFSLADALGYVLARNLGLPFLTGDPAFEGMAGVTYVGRDV